MNMMLLIVLSSLALNPPEASRELGVFYLAWNNDRSLEGSLGQPLHYPAPALVEASSPQWHRRQLEEMARVGIDFVIPIFGRDREESVRALSQALDQLADSGRPYPKVAYFLNASKSLFRASGRSLEELPSLSSPRALLDEARFFFEAIDERHWFLQQTRAVIVLSRTHSPGPMDEQQFARWKKSLAPSLQGRAPYILKENTWRVASDANYRGGGSLEYAESEDAVTVGPGHDSTYSSWMRYPVREREGGTYYRWCWHRALRSEARMVLLETWNDVAHGSALTVTAEHGYHYLDETRRFAEHWHQGSLPDEPTPLLHYPAPRPHGFIHRGWESRGLSLARFDANEQTPSTVWPTNLNVYPVRYNRESDSLSPRGDTPSVAFDVADPFLYAPRHDCRLSLEITSLRGGRLILRTANASTQWSLEPSSSPQRIDVELERPSWRGELGGADILLEGEFPYELHRMVLEKRQPRGLAFSVSLDIHQDEESFDLSLEDARRLGVEALRLKVSWRQWRNEDLERLAKRIDEASSAGFQITVALEDPPSGISVWRQSNRLAGLARALLSSTTSIDALEILPGLDTRRGFPPMALPERAHAVIRDVALAAHRVDPSVSIIPGTLTERELSFLKVLLQADRGLFIDALSLSPSPTDIDAESSGLRDTIRSIRETTKEIHIPPIPIRIAEVEYLTVKPTALPSEEIDFLANLMSFGYGFGLEEELEELREVTLIDQTRVPVVGGFDPARLGASLKDLSWNVEWASGQDPFLPSTTKAILVPHGEAFDARVEKNVTDYLDAGGYVIRLGPVPFTYRVRHEGERQVLENTGPEKFDRLDDLWLAFRDPRRDLELPSRSSLFKATPLLRRASVPAPNSSLTYSQLLYRRPGRPTSPKARHHYLPLIQGLDAKGQPLGEVASLYLYQSGHRRGRLLMITMEGHAGYVDERGQEERISILIDLASEEGVSSLAWKIPRDREDHPGGLLYVNGDVKPGARLWKGR